MTHPDIKLRNLTLDDLDSFYKLNHPKQKFHTLNGPYFKKRSEVELKNFINTLRERLVHDDPTLHDTSQLIVLNESNQLIGQVSCYWVSKETLWLNIGIVIFDENFWGKGMGHMALNLWIERVFLTHPEIIRLGLTTWSGNTGMMNLAEKLGFKLEARFRKARIVKGEYFDSLGYGILRDEWENS